MDLHNSAPNAPRDRVFHTLDALRGIAAIGVVAFHTHGLFGVAIPGGYLAVDLFFMMSGVVLAHAYERRFLAGMGTRKFMQIRIIRLYPLYFFAAVLSSLVAVASLFGRNSQGWSVGSLGLAMIAAFLFVPDVGRSLDRPLFPLNIPCWSLFLELLVNIAFVATRRFSTSRRLVAVCLFTGCGLALLIVHRGNIDQGSVVATFFPGLVRATFGFSVGILIARRIRDRAPPRRANDLGFLGIVGIVILAIAGWPRGEWRPMWDAACVLAVFPLAVYWGTLVDPSRWLRMTATFLGVTSYAVYVLQSPLLAMANSMTRHFPGTPRAIGASMLGAAGLVGLLLIAWLTDRYFDLPLRRLLSRMQRRSEAAVVAGRV